MILEATCGYSLMLKNLIKGSAETFSVLLNEDQGWVDSRTKRKPGLFDMLGVLSNLKSIRIRGTCAYPCTVIVYVFYRLARLTRLFRLYCVLRCACVCAMWGFVRLQVATTLGRRTHIWVL